MTIKTIRDFKPGSRYAYDFGPCTYANGWAQIDTPSDAAYYGNWCNPSRLAIASYVEGDVTLITCDTAEEFVAELRSMDEWHRANTGDRIKIDPGFTHTEAGKIMLARLVAVGAAPFLHGEDGQ